MTLVVPLSPSSYCAQLASRIIPCICALTFAHVENVRIGEIDTAHYQVIGIWLEAIASSCISPVQVLAPLASSSIAIFSTKLMRCPSIYMPQRFRIGEMRLLVTSASLVAATFSSSSLNP